MNLRYRENETYKELELFDGDVKIGEAEVDIKGKMISRLNIYEPYQNKGYGTAIVKMLMRDYGCDCLWVNADNDRAIHVYEKCGFEKVKPTMYLMELNGSDSDACKSCIQAGGDWECDHIHCHIGNKPE